MLVAPSKLKFLHIAFSAMKYLLNGFECVIFLLDFILIIRICIIKKYDEALTILSFLSLYYR